jgi:fatty acid desaturase
VEAVARSPRRSNSGIIRACPNHHLEHHLLVFVPCWKLRQVHALLLAKGLGGRMERAAGYPEIIGRATSAGS